MFNNPFKDMLDGFGDLVNLEKENRDEFLRDYIEQILKDNFHDMPFEVYLKYRTFKIYCKSTIEMCVERNIHALEGNYGGEEYDGHYFDVIALGMFEDIMENMDSLMGGAMEQLEKQSFGES